MASKAAETTSNLDELDNFFLDGDLEDDPFASPKGDKAGSGTNKRKEPGDGLGLDEEVSVAKKARVPRIKLDQDRLMSQKGIPALRRRAKDLRIKGKGHEWGDASRLLSFYQEWLDDLFPKAKFLDALGMVEKAGHNKAMHLQRVAWINEGRPKTSVIDDGGDAEPNHQEQQTGELATKQTERIAPIFNKAATSARHETPDVDDLFGDEDDIYNATPTGTRKTGTITESRAEPDEDELDALMAMAEAESSGPTKPATTNGGGIAKSIFGNGKPKATAPAQNQEEDDLDALIAEAEAEQASRKKLTPASAGGNAEPPKTGGAGGYDDDDLDALMAEAEAHFAPAKSLEVTKQNTEPSIPDFNAEEEAMAEMDGLW